MNVGRYLELAREALAEVRGLTSANADPTLPLGLKDEHTERPGASVLDYESNEENEKSPEVPPAWREGVARLAVMLRPAQFSRNEWVQVRTDAAAFLGRWGPTAARLGWPCWSLWGVQRRVPSSWRGRELVALLGGRPVVALTAGEAVIEVRPGQRLTYRRPARDPLHPAERCLLWGLEGQPTRC